jgi:3-phenylpropionate/trans-cinnamate dioxygenase ferredoxin reductase subunit
VRLESVQAATDHARTIAARLTGAPAVYKSVPWFWSDQGDFKLQIAGLSIQANAWQIVESTESRLVVLCFRDEVFCAVETINAVAPHMAGRKLLATERKFQRSDFQEDNFDLRAAAKRLL